MDFGARLCVPKNPDCANCPLTSTCFAFQKGLVKDLPVKINKTKVKERSLHYFVIRCGKNWVWKKRASGDIWEGLHDFPLEEKTSTEFTKLAFPTSEIPESIPKKYRHILSHQNLMLVFLNLTFLSINTPNCLIGAKMKDICWFPKMKLRPWLNPN